MSNLFFDISEWLNLNGVEAEIPLSTSKAQKIFQYHLLPSNVIRDEINLPIHVRSGYRPIWWEKIQGRNPNDKSNDRQDWSQHCFLELGASDLSIEKYSESEPKPQKYWLQFLELLKESPFKRIAYYESLRFFHLDYKGDQREYILGEGWQQSDYSTLAKLVGTNQNQNEGHNDK